MATKTFKIGLSNTDKQNMAQDVYERLLALTFPEYDTTTEYEVGDFVVYNDQLYKCIGATSGAWDSTKWQLATLNDLVTDIEDAVAFVNSKANVDGNYPTLTAGLADNLTPYSEDSGAEQEKPFISNGTGTNNNTEIVTVGDYGLLKEKQGHTLAVNQLFTNNNFASTSGWTKVGTGDGSISVSNGVLTFTTTNGDTGIRQGGRDFIAGHKYLTMFQVKTNTNGLKLQGYSTISQNNLTSVVDSIANTWQTLIGICQIDQTTSSSVYLYCNKNQETGSITVEYKNPLFIDLTQWFNGDIPQDLLDNPDHFSWYYNGDLSFNEGSLVNANGVRLVSTKRNLWDEEWEVGGIDNSTGNNKVQATTIRSKNYISVIPNTKYYIKSSYSIGDYGINLYYYDRNKNFVNLIEAYGITPTIPNNVCYIRFVLSTVYGTTYKHDITISLYYTPEEGGEGYDQYYPYEEPYVVETGSEVLRQAGSIKDYKEPNGTVHRLVGVVDLGSLDYTQQSSPENHIFRVSLNSQLNDIKRASNNSSLVNAICSIYQQKTFTAISASDNMCFAVSQDVEDRLVIINQAYSSNSAFKTAMSGVYLFYELAEPTTEQGTQFAENLPTNDYGMLYWVDSSNNLVGIPQGAKIFYPVNYKGFVDDMYSKVDGNSDDYALNSELNAKFETYLKSLTGYDSTATQVLKNVEGTLTWITEGE